MGLFSIEKGRVWGDLMVGASKESLRKAEEALLTGACRDRE